MTPIPFVILALCGLAFGAERPVPRLDGRIVGGEQTTIDKYPYQLSVRSGGYHFCGASIIGPKHALTAAHCVRNGSPNGISLHAGTSYKTQVGSKHNAVKVTVHPRYGSSDYDYAIIEVGTPFPIGQEGIQSIELCSVEPSAGETSVISGWGAVSSGGGSSNYLHVVSIPIISRAACQDKYDDYSITERMICAAMENGGKDACQGDSGGPLVVNGKQCGVVSWGVGCADPNYPGVYANVADQISWIKGIAGL